MTDKQFSTFLVDRISENRKLREMALSEGAVKVVQELQKIIDRDTVSLRLYSGQNTQNEQRVLLEGKYSP